MLELPKVVVLAVESGYMEVGLQGRTEEEESSALWNEGRQRDER